MSEPSAPQAVPGTTVYVQQAPATPSNGLAIASMVLGIIALVVVWIPIFGMIAWILAPLGLIFGLIAMRKPVGRGQAIAGVVCSAVGLLGCIAWLLLFGLAASDSDVNFDVNVSEPQVQEDLATTTAAVEEAEKQALDDLAAATATIEDARAERAGRP